MDRNRLHLFMLVGRVTAGWGEIHATIYTLFLRVSRLDEDRGTIVFDALASGHAQRAVTLELARLALQTDAPALLCELEAVIQEIDRIEAAGRSPTHAPFQIIEEGRSGGDRRNTTAVPEISLGRGVVPSPGDTDHYLHLGDDLFDVEKRLFRLLREVATSPARDALGAGRRA
jgi:hypothetical protein